MNYKKNNIGIIYHTNRDVRITENSSGITLIALVVTIIIIIILSTISLSVLFGENGIISRTDDEAKNYKNKETEEKLDLAVLTTKLNSQIKGEQILSASAGINKVIFTRREDSTEEYEKYAKKMLKNMTEDEKEQSFISSINFWRMHYDDGDTPINNLDEAFEYYNEGGCTSLEELADYLSYNSIDDMMISRAFVYANRYLGEINISCYNNNDTLTMEKMNNVDNLITSRNYVPDNSYDKMYFLATFDDGYEEVLEVKNVTIVALEPMVTKWNIDNDGDTLELPIIDFGPYEFTVLWGDGTEETYSGTGATIEGQTMDAMHSKDNKFNVMPLINLNIPKYNITKIDVHSSFYSPVASHTYQQSGEYNIEIYGTFTTWDTTYANYYGNAIMISFNINENIQLKNLFKQNMNRYKIEKTSNNINYDCAGEGNYENYNLLEVVNWGNCIADNLVFAYSYNLEQIASPSENSFQNIRDFKAMFMGCESLVSIPEDLFANCPNAESFQYTFAGCNNLTGDPIPLWTRGTNNSGNDYRGNPDGECCYYGCSGLNGYNSIPEYWVYGLPGDR